MSDYLSPSEAAAMCRVDTRTLIRWVEKGKLTAVRTPGGHRRYPRAEIEAVIRSDERIIRRIAGDDPQAAEQINIINALISGARTRG
jgi:excisionase family DNA binding protein